MKETTLTNSMRAALSKKGQYCRVENAVSKGMPDVNFFRRGKEHWIEAKIVRGQRVSFEASQITWMKTRIRHGGEVIVFIRKENEMWVLKASKIVDRMVYVTSHMKPHLELHQVRELHDFYTKKPMDWEGVLDFLKSY